MFSFVIERCTIDGTFDVSALSGDPTSYDLPNRDMLSKVVNTMAQEMKKVNDSQRITYDYEHDYQPTDVPWMLHFEGFY